MPNPSDCPHRNFQSIVMVNRLEDVGKFTVDFRIHCVDCGLPFRFLGLPVGLNLSGAGTSVDGIELRAAIAPGASGLIPRPPLTETETGH